MAKRAAGEERQRWGTRPVVAAVSELRIRVGGVEIAVAGESREDCFRQLEAAAQEVDEETRLAEAGWVLTDAGHRALAGTTGVAA